MTQRFHVSAVPTREPEALVARNTSSTSIVVTWRPLADPWFLHGVLRGYKLSFQRTDGSGPKSRMLLCSNNLTVQIFHLVKFADYTIEIRSFNWIGQGPAAVVRCTTDQDGKSGLDIGKHF